MEYTSCGIMIYLKQGSEQRTIDDILSYASQYLSLYNVKVHEIPTTRHITGFFIKRMCTLIHVSGNNLTGVKSATSILLDHAKRIGIKAVSV